MIMTMHSDQNGSPPRVEVITSIQRRRRWPTAEKMRLVEETMQPGMSVSYVARRAGVAPSLLFNWRRRMLEGGLQAVQADEDVVGTSRVCELERRVRELERPLGRKTMEVEILKEALDVARVKNRACSCHHGTIGRTVRHEGGGRYARGRPFEPDRAGEPPRQVA
jgi:transposase